jgi:hypothetical protein
VSVYTFINFDQYVCLVFFVIITGIGARGSVVVKALCYKLEGRGFDIR